VDATVRNQNMFGVVDRRAVLLSQFCGEQLTKSRNTGRLQVVSFVFRDRAGHRVLDAVGRVEADVALVEAIWVRDRIHHVANPDDAGERNLVQIRGHAPSLLSGEEMTAQRAVPFSIARPALGPIVSIH
jgi:hypothetical protein